MRTHRKGKSPDNAFLFRLIMIKPRLKDDFIPMPALQYSKCENTVNAICDNGRILCAEYIEILLTDPDLEVIYQQYTCDKSLCVEVQVAKKDGIQKLRIVATVLQIGIEIDVA